jgi:hypothetical protein
MRMDSALQIFRAGGEFQRQHRLRDQLAGHGANDVHTQYFVIVF